MSLTLPDHWVWDFWLARDGRHWHIFYLRAPVTLGDPERRHSNATIGHARSSDLRTWQVQPDPFGLGSAGSWDDLATWTGSTVRSGATWWTFYTGVSTGDDGRIQRIGAAVSADLTTWTKVSSNPLCVADQQWYEQFDAQSWYEEAWRDPWVFPDPGGDGWHMFVTARAKSGLPASRGVVGHATSPDLESWTVRPPVAVPGAYGYLEVPQQISIRDRHYLVFSVSADMQAGVDTAEALTGIGYLVADSPIGPYRRGPTPFVAADRSGTRYAGKIVIHEIGPLLLATRHHAADGSYVGEIADPIPVAVAADGALSLVSRVGEP